MDNAQVTQWRKKPVVITAVQINTQEDAERCPGVCTGGPSCKSKGAPDDAWPHIHTLEGDHTWTPGDWCITGVKGERYFCKPDIFAQTYEPAESTGLDDAETVNGWIIGNGDGTKWRTWEDGLPSWTDDPRDATRYARREDAEAVHYHDEDAWTVYPARHRLERSEPVGWMGIESAPKDWTDVLVFSPEHEGFNCGGVFSAFYAEGEENCWFAHGPAHNIRLNPTHWMPLPSAPGTTPPEPVAEIERLRGALRRLTDERTLQTTIPEGPWTPEMVAEFQSKEVGHMRDLARAALGHAS